MKPREIIVFTFLLAFLLLPTFMGTFMAGDLGTVGIRILYLLSGILFYAFFLVLNKRRTFFFVMAFMTFFFSAVEMVHLTINHATTSLLFVYTIIASEPGEFLELFSTYWWGLFVFGGLWWLYYYLTKHVIRDQYLIPRRLWRYGAAGVIATYFLVGIIVLHFNHTPPRWLPQNNEDVRTTAFVGMEKISPINIGLAAYHIIDIGTQIRRQQENLRNYSFGIPTDYSGDDIVILLLGETSRYDHWQLNGYERQTSPRLLARGDELVSFDSCYSIANLTTVSVPFMLSPATPEEPHRFYTEKSVVEAFQEAGWHTAWIADQSFGNPFLQRISSTCDYCFYPPRSQLTFFDTILIAPMNRFINQSGKQMLVLHSLGCHFKYSARYPDEYCVFQPDMRDLNVRELISSMNPEKGSLSEEGKALDELRNILVNSYDNAILYTDYFIDTVLTCLERSGRSIALVYVGDHGENLLDDERNMFLHGTFYGSRYEYHVPLFVWLSPEYRRRYPATADILRENRRKTFSTMALFNSLLDLGHIPYAGLDSTASFVSPHLRSLDVVHGLDANLKCFEIER